MEYSTSDNILTKCGSSNQMKNNAIKGKICISCTQI
jgi:hypothetical protein